MKDFVIDTSDNRMIYVKKFIENKGYSTYEYSRYNGENEAIYIFSPAKKFSAKEIDNLNAGSLVYAGNIEMHLKESMIMRNITHINLLQDEVYAYENAIYTAEVALMLIIRNTASSIYDMNMLILGYGRVGKAMANLLSTLGVKFAIAARRYEERASAYLVTSDIRGLDSNFDGIDVIINTIPARIIDSESMRRISHDCYILDLASYDVMDSSVAEENELRYSVEHGLPGRFTPRTAGESLVKSVLRTIEV